MQITIIGARNMARGIATWAPVGGHTVTVTAKDPAKAARCASSSCAPSLPLHPPLACYPIRPPLVCHHPHLSAALNRVLQTAGYSTTTDLEEARRHCYGTTAAMPSLPTSPPGRPTGGSPCPH